MKDISLYFKPTDIFSEFREQSLGSKIIKHTQDNFPELNKKGIAIFTVPEYRNSYTGNVANDYKKFRFCLDQLHTQDNWKFEIYDLGTIMPGNKTEDTYFAVANASAELIKKQILPIVIGGSQDLTYAMYKAYEKLEQTVNLCCIDRGLNLGNPDDRLNSEGFISKMLLERPCYLFNHSVIACQAPYMPAKEMDLFEKLYFDTVRLGEFNKDLRHAEPHLRNADLLSLDMNVVRYSDYPAPHNSPNGLYADQLCQIAKYAGMSDKLSSFGMFEIYDPENKQEESENIFASLLAEVCWYFFDGYAQRVGDFPIGSKKDYIKFTVHLEDVKDEVVFYKSHKSERWWMEVPYPMEKGNKYERHYLVPCNHSDYDLAMKNELPDLWWKTFQKLSV